jgi:hypothetical protein
MLLPSWYYCPLHVSQFLGVQLIEPREVSIAVRATALQMEAQERFIVREYLEVVLPWIAQRKLFIVEQALAPLIYRPELFTVLKSQTVVQRLTLQLGLCIVQTAQA